MGFAIGIVQCPHKDHFTATLYWGGSSDIDDIGAAAIDGFLCART